MGYLRLLQLSRLMDEANDGTGGDAGGGAPPAAKPPEEKPPAAPTADVQAMIDAAVSKAVTANNATRDEKEAGLKKNKEELHGELKELQKKTKEKEDAIRMKEGNVEEVTAEINARVEGEYKEKLAEQSTAIENYKNEAHTKDVEAFVNEIVNQSNIKPAFKRARKLEIMADSKFGTDESGNMTIDGRNQQEFVKNWQENGQNVNDYVLAPQSNGGGAQGGKNDAGASGHAQVLESTTGNLFTAATKLVKT